MRLKSKMPLQVWILTLAAFAIGTAEFVIAGILTQVSEVLHISEGQAGHLITAYALAIVIGGPILTLWLARYPKHAVLVGLMILFVISNIITAISTDFITLMISRTMAGLTQGPFYGIGAVVATRLVSDKMAGQAVGQMFAGLTLANVLGVPAGAWIGNIYGWNATFFVIAILGGLAALAIAIAIPPQKAEEPKSIIAQIRAFRNPQLRASLMITILSWVGFMTFYGYIAPIAEEIAGIERSSITWILMIVGVGLLLGNILGGKTADKNLSASLIGWPAAMIASLIVIGLVASQPYLFVLTAFIFGIVSFANVPPMQMRVMKHGQEAPELAATVNISAFNLANAFGGIIGGLVVDSSYGAGYIPFAAAIVPIIGLVFIIWQESKPRAFKATA
jgi:MFS transporter, DHA1 family, inner membrane transport protein